jgi:mRNA-degrading endonuclease RelE of RelBE toxin-antitoxin system
MSRLDELLRGLADREKIVVKDQLKKLKEQRWSELNIKKLKGNTYRLKKGRLRIFYEKLPQGKFKVLKIGRRDSQTYRDF